MKDPEVTYRSAGSDCSSHTYIEAVSEMPQAPMQTLELTVVISAATVSAVRPSDRSALSMANRPGMPKARSTGFNITRRRKTTNVGTAKMCAASRKAIEPNEVTVV